MASSIADTSHNAPGAELCPSSMDVTSQRDSGSVVYSSLMEQVLALTSLAAILIVTLVGQVCVLATIIWTERLHSPHFYIIGTYCVGDLFMALSSTPIYIWQFAKGCLPKLPCKIASDIAISSGFGLASHIGLLSFERYIYFCYPMKYESIFKKCSLVVITIAMYVAPLSYAVATEVGIGRTYHATILACNLPAPGIQSMLQLVLFILPAAVITVFSSVKIWRLTKHSSVAPAIPTGNPSHDTSGRADPEPDTGASATQHASRAFRMIMLVSGAFWGTIIPAYLIRTVLFSLGYTWRDLDSREYFLQSVLLRMSNYLYSSVSSFLNPIIYFFSIKDLRLGFKQMVSKIWART